MTAFKIINPINISDAMLIASDIPENDYTAYNSGTTYARGDYCISTITHTVYRSLTDANTDNDPDLEQAALLDPLIDDPSPINWQVISATNLWKLFDKKPSNLTSQSNTMECTVVLGEFIQGIAGFEIDAGIVDISIYDPNSDSIVYTKTINMQDESVVFDGYSYFFEPIARVSDFVLTDIPPYADAEITVTIDNTGGNAKCGQLVFGKIWEIGVSKIENAQFSGLDFSYVDTDEFGNLETVQRPATQVYNFETFVMNSLLNQFKTKINNLRGGIPAVWIASEVANWGTFVYGFYRDYRNIYQTKDYSIISFEIQGIV